MKRIVLIQFRNVYSVTQHEKECFKRAIVSKYVTLSTIDAFKKTISLKNILHQYDGIILGGSHLSVRNDFSGKHKVNELIKKSVQIKKPFFGVCFGFQLMIESLGGKVSRMKKFEIGSRIVYQARGVRQSALLTGVPAKFYAQQMHEWSVSRLPIEAQLLMRGNRVRTQGIYVKGTKAYGAQFHPEHTKETFKRRLGIYCPDSASCDFLSPGDVTSLKPTPCGKTILKNFVHNIVTN